MEEVDHMSRRCAAIFLFGGGGGVDGGLAMG